MEGTAQFRLEKVKTENLWEKLTAEQRPSKGIFHKVMSVGNQIHAGQSSRSIRIRSGVFLTPAVSFWVTYCSSALLKMG